MVNMRVAFHENDENDEDNSDSYNELSAGLAEVTETMGIRGANHGFPNQRGYRDGLFLRAENTFGVYLFPSDPIPPLKTCSCNSTIRCARVHSHTMGAGSLGEG